MTMERPSEVKILVGLEIAYVLAMSALFTGFKIFTGEWFAALWVVPAWVLILAYALWTRRRWAWTVALVFSVICVVGGVIWIVVRGWTGALDVVFNAPLIYVLTRPQVRVFFRELEFEGV